MPNFEAHITPLEFCKKNHFGMTKATPHRSCNNCCYSGFNAGLPFHCQHPDVRPRKYYDSEGRESYLDVALAITDNRDTCCDQFAEVVSENRWPVYEQLRKSQSLIQTIAIRR